MKKHKVLLLYGGLLCIVLHAGKGSSSRRIKERDRQQSERNALLAQTLFEARSLRGKMVRRTKSLVKQVLDDDDSLVDLVHKAHALDENFTFSRSRKKIPWFACFCVCCSQRITV